MNNEEIIQEEEFIDVKAILLGYVRYFRRRWYLLLLLALLGAGAGFAYARMSQYSECSATATYMVEKSSDVVSNAELTSRLADGISTITQTTDFHEQMDEALGTSVSGYSIGALATTDANLMTVYVTGTDADQVNDILEVFDQVYAPWVTDLVGSCTITKADESLCTGPYIYGRSKIKMMALGFAGGAVIWLVLATISLFLQNTILSSSQMNRVTTSTCMGTIPEVAKKKREKSTRDPLLMSAKNIHPGYQQSIREIRYGLEKRMKGKKVLLLTSTMPGEGKSLLTLNLAYDLKNHGKKVIVIDADLYHHGIAELLQAEETDKKTLLDYMTEEDPLPENLAEELSEYDGISVLFGSRNTEVDADSLNMGKFEQIITALKENVNYILIDTPPVGTRGDAILFSETADAVWYIVRYDYADVQEIRKGMAPFYRNEKLDGYLINRTDQENGEERYGGRYRYGYGYGYGYGSKRKGNRKKTQKEGDDVRLDDDMLDW